MRLLLIEPHQLLARAFRRGLEEEGIVVDLAEDPREADAKARTACYDVILLDLDRPEEPGLALVRGWRQGGLATPVLLLTVPGHNGPIQRGNLGVYSTLSKPLRLEVLLARLRDLACRNKD